MKKHLDGLDWVGRLKKSKMLIYELHVQAKD